MAIMTDLEKYLDLIINGTYYPLINGDFISKESNTDGDNLQIFMSYDGDISVLSVINPDVKKHVFNDFNHVVNGNKVLYFNLNNDTSLFNHSLFVLAEAIRLDNEELRLSLLSTKEYTKEETIIAYNWMINNSHKFETLKSTSYKRVQDDNDGDQDSAIEIVINNEMIELHCNCGDSFRFRTSCGGGKSLRVRNALIYLAYVAENKL